MLYEKSAPKSGENVWLWLLKILSGLAIVVLLAVHLIVNHLVAEGGLLSHAEVVAYYTNPWIVFMEAAFLLVVVSHSLVGLRSIILDLKPSRAVLRIIDFAFVVIGVTSSVYGLWLLQAVVRQA
jgi:succinate dehydrogenase / fumarate reductase membrane anchor subunit